MLRYDNVCLYLWCLNTVSTLFNPGLFFFPVLGTTYSLEAIECFHTLKSKKQSSMIAE